MLYGFDRPTAIDINCSLTFGSSILGDPSLEVSLQVVKKPVP
jgi:hypothetical protein